MSQLEWYRNFTAVYRTGSVSGAAKIRNLTQPAVSQQLANLEEAVGAKLFQRSPKGMIPTNQGKALYAQVYESLDRLERVMRLARRKEAFERPQIRLGVSADYAHQKLLGAIHNQDWDTVLQLGENKELWAQLEQGSIDFVICNQKPSSRTLEARELHSSRFVLVGHPDLEPPDPQDVPTFARWLAQQPWVSYSLELPTTRRFWQNHLGLRFASRQALIVADLRSVAWAVALGMGVSLLPEFVCATAPLRRQVKLLWPSLEGPSESWFLLYRTADSDRPEIEVLALELGRGLESSLD
jgi:DNA-binding transcriptional LysR family regulator